MKKIFTRLEEGLLHSTKWSDNWNNENFYNARNLWEKVRRLSQSPREALDRIESILPPRPIDELISNDYVDFVCDSASFYITGLLESKDLIPGSVIPTPYYIYDSYKGIRHKGLIEIDSPKKSKMTLVVMREDPNKDPGAEELEDKMTGFHFAVDLSLRSGDRIVFHKPGYNPPALSYLSTITSYYENYAVNYWSHERDLF